MFTRITKVQHTLKSCYLFVFSLSNDQQILNYTPEGRSPKIQQLSKKSTYNKRTAKRLAAQVEFLSELLLTCLHVRSKQEITELSP